jgi:hypothetical protein
MHFSLFLSLSLSLSLSTRRVSPFTYNSCTSDTAEEAVMTFGNSIIEQEIE